MRRFESCRGRGHCEGADRRCPPLRSTPCPLRGEERRPPSRRSRHPPPEAGSAGGSTTIEVPWPGGLVSAIVPPRASTRCRRPTIPDPRASSAPPQPSSRMRRRRTPSSASSSTLAMEASASWPCSSPPPTPRSRRRPPRAPEVAGAGGRRAPPARVFGERASPGPGRARPRRGWRDGGQARPRAARRAGRQPFFDPDSSSRSSVISAGTAARNPLTLNASVTRCCWAPSWGFRSTRSARFVRSGDDRRREAASSARNDRSRSSSRNYLNVIDVTRATSS